MRIDLDNIRIEPLTDLHSRESFRCAERTIQSFCRGRLADHNRRRMIKAYVACERGRKDVLGFYTLVSTSVEPEALGPRGQAGEFLDLKLIPAVYLGMLGVHRPLMRQGLGTQLMHHALHRVLDLSTIAGVWALTLDAIDEASAGYYERFDFKRFSPGGLEMYLTLGTIQNAIDNE